MNIYCIGVDSDVISRMQSYDIPPNYMGTTALIPIGLLMDELELLDEMDQNSKSKEMLMLYRDLSRKGLIEESNNDEDTSRYLLTEEGRSLASQINENYRKVVMNDPVEEKVVSAKFTSKKVDKIEDWIEEYISLFPTGKIEGKVLRRSTAECLPRMKAFINKYGYGKDIIIEATKRYLKDEEGGKQHTRNSKYFIEKHDKEKGYISDLLTYCEIVGSQKEEAYINSDVI